MIGSGAQDLWGPDGEQFNSYTNRRYPLGTALNLQDGRKFRFVENGAVALVAGVLVQSEVPDADHDTLAIATSAAIGDRAINITNGADTIEADLYADGYCLTEAAAGTGEGYVYRIDKTHAAIANAAAGNIPLAAGYGVQVALTAGSDTLTLIKSPYKDVIIHPSPPTALPVGVTAAAIAANSFGWVQTRGLCGVLIDGTVVIGTEVMASDAVDGAVEDWALAEAAPNTLATLPVGRVVEVAPDTAHGFIYLTLE